MAELKGNVMGLLRGSIGNITGRVRYGKNYLASKPVSFKMPLDEDSVKRRAKFKLAVKFCSAVLKNPILKEIWRPYAKNKKLVFQHLVPINYNLMVDNNLSKFNLITPPNGINIEIESIAFFNNELIVEIAPISKIVHSEIRITGIIYFSNPTEDMYDEYRFDSLEATGEINEMKISFRMILPDNRLNKYTNKKIYLAVYALDKLNNPLHFSSTYFKQIE